VEEELALHDEEGQVVQRPADRQECAEAIIESDGGC
jgi:hypothetical protein